MTALLQDRRVRHDWLDILRGDLPRMAPRGPGAKHRSMQLLFTCVLFGLLVGVVTGAVCGALVAALADPIFVVLGLPFGAAVGLVVAVIPSLVLGGTIAWLAGRLHGPLRDPHRFHRHVWTVLLVGVGLLDLVPLLLMAGTTSQHLAFLLAVPTVIALLLLRWVARRIVMFYAVASGWLPNSSPGVCSEPVPG